MASMPTSPAQHCTGQMAPSLIEDVYYAKSLIRANEHRITGVRPSARAARSLRRSFTHPSSVGTIGRLPLLNICHSLVYKDQSAHLTCTYKPPAMLKQPGSLGSRTGLASQRCIIASRPNLCIRNFAQPKRSPCQRPLTTRSALVTEKEPAQQVCEAIIVKKMQSMSSQIVDGRCGEARSSSLLLTERTW